MGYIKLHDLNFILCNHYYKKILLLMVVVRPSERVAVPFWCSSVNIELNL